MTDAKEGITGVNHIRFLGKNKIMKFMVDTTRTLWYSIGCTIV